MPIKIQIHPKYGPLFIINPESRFPFTFGIGKAKMIVENADAIRDFVKRFDTGPIALDEAASDK